MSQEFRDQWSKYVSLFWQRVYCRIDTSDLFPKETIVAWGSVSYEEYKNSIFFIDTPIYIDNKTIKVYYYVRRISCGNVKFFAFVNLPLFFNSIYNMTEMDIDHLFILKIYKSKLSFENIFDHKYSLNCWMSIQLSANMNLN
jgi:hypothetical protein